MAMYSIRSERAFCERLNSTCCSSGSWTCASISRRSTRRRSPRTAATVDHEVADEFFAAVVRQAKLRRYISSEHFSVNGTLLSAWASAQELQAERRTQGWPAAGRPQRRGRWHGGNARTTRTPPRRIRGSAVSQEQQHRGDAVLLGASVDGEPQHADRRRRTDHRATGTPSGPPRSRCWPGSRQPPASQVAATRVTTPAGSWPMPAARVHAARRAARQRSTISDRWAHHPTRRA